MLITIDDLQAALNIDLTDPEGQDLAESLIASATTWIATVLGYPIEQTEVTTYFDGEYQRIWLPTGAPVSNLVMSSYNTTSDSYDTVDAQYVRNLGDARVSVTQVFPLGDGAVKAVYTTGWTAESLPRDLRQALIDIVGLKLLEVANFSSDPSTDSSDTDGEATMTTTLKRVTSGAYTEEYGSAEGDARWKAKAAQLSRSIGDSVPQSIQDLLAHYRKPFAL